MTAPIILHGNNIDLLRDLPDNSIDSIVTDPPYELGFMGKKWDSSGIAYSVELWSECLRVLKHGGHLLAFSGSRTYHRMVVAIEDAGFEIRDQIMWVYGSGFPKSLDISKAINKQAGVEFEAKPASGVGFMNANDDGYNTTLNQLVQTGDSVAEAQQWSGWGTALKPAHEPIVMARKPIDGTVANNVLKHGVGGINIEASRIAHTDDVNLDAVQRQQQDNNWGGIARSFIGREIATYKPSGRFPANFIHDGSEEVLALFPDSTSKSGGKSGTNANPMSWSEQNKQRDRGGHDDSGSAARFFYCAKASKAERNAGLEELPEQTSGVGALRDGGRESQPRQNFHPTVKPIALMRYLVRMVTPPNGTVLDPFAGSGTTLVAAILEGFNPIGMELTADYLPIINARVDWALKQPREPEQPTLF